jgi:hypothetical protein
LRISAGETSKITPISPDLIIFLTCSPPRRPDLREKTSSSHIPGLFSRGTEGATMYRGPVSPLPSTPDGRAAGGERGESRRRRGSSQVTVQRGEERRGEWSSTPVSFTTE